MIWRKIVQLGFLAGWTVLGTGLPAQPVLKVATAEGHEQLFPLVTAIYAELGYKAEITVLPAERSLLAVNSGEYDAELVRAKGVLGPYPNLLATSEPILTVHLQAWGRKDSGVQNGGEGSLKDYKIGLMAGIKIAETYVAVRGLRATVGTDLKSLAKMLDLGMVDLVLLPDTFVSRTWGGTYKILGPSLLTTVSFHIFNRKHQDLAGQWDQILRAMKADGRFQQLTAER